MKLIISVVFLSFIAVVSGCNRNEPIKIGYVGCLTGKNSDLGIAGRDAVMLAVDELNSQGGINGKKVRLIEKNDELDPKVAEKVVNELVQAKVAAVVGHIASSMTKVSLPIVNKAKIVMVSPTSSSNELSGQDDYFFRVMEPNMLFALHQAETADKLKIRKIAVIYDIQNKPYTVDIFQAFKEEFTRNGGKIGVEQTFDSNTKPEFLPLVQKLDLKNADAVLLLASNVDSINIAQQIRKEQPNLPIISGACGVAQRELLKQAGKSINNIIFTVPVNSQCSTGEYLKFKASFAKRYGYEPTMAATLSYDAAQVIFSGLKINSDPAQLKTTINRINPIAGVQGSFELDKFGDPHRNLTVIRFINGREEILR